MYPEERGNRNCVLPPLIPRNLWHFSGGRERRRGKPTTGGRKEDWKRPRQDWADGAAPLGISRKEKVEKGERALEKKQFIIEFGEKRIS